MTQDDRDPRTGLIHHPYRAPEGFESPVVGVHKGSTVFFPNVAAMRARTWKDKSGYTYGLHGTPTTFTLEERIATLEGGRHTLLVSSGLAAIMLVNLSLLRAGDEVLLPDNVYGPSRDLAVHELAQYGITHRIYDPMGGAGALRAAIGERTRLVWLEAAGSVTLEFPDLRGLVAAARERGVTVALDNTWGAGIAFRPFDLGEGLGVDVSIHALTKYPSGGGDVLMGAVTTVDRALHERIMMTHSRFGLGVGANDAELVLRSLPSLHLRYHAQDASARRIAAWAQQRPEVARVLHPALPGSPGHEHWAAQCSAAAGLLSIAFQPRHDAAAVDRFVDALRLFRIGYSWGGPVSLVVPYPIQAMRTFEAPVAGTLVRLCIGLERTEDLIADLEQALGAL
ncbi:cystathionine beta-lyase [Caldimonas thermodepolymerans]|uniref:Cystathionine beta-lyase n=1 Tax=Caldimonas thermodepolymerans TaxID=215580 RepID=A0AA46DHH5_9BURK|nr:cystathionine beta-lyase [Caldimonas thermodepolymerans]TCP09903.1 cystathionine beta-lyase [Caldimonas thermodepolymerans]UZG46293.1 cystathionine beta-lyase [Caldimonas thermodepolymerans]